MILITGATGFVGSHLVARLKREGQAVRCLVRPTSDVAWLRQHSVELVTGSVNDPQSLQVALRGATAVVHLVAIIRERGRQTFNYVNYLGTKAVVEAAQEAGVPRFIHMSALGARSDPAFPYLCSKWRGEETVRASGIPFVILRPSLLFGARDEFINMLASLLKIFPVFPIAGSGKTPFQPIWVEDVASCIIVALRRDDLLGQTIEIGGPEYLTYEEMVDIVLDTLQLRRLKLHLPMPAIRLAVLFMERLLPHPPATLHQLSMLQLDNTTQLNTVEHTFGFKPSFMRTKLDYILH